MSDDPSPGGAAAGARARLRRGDRPDRVHRAPARRSRPPSCRPATARACSSPTTATAARCFYCPGGVLTARPTLAFDKTAIAADGIDVATLAIDGAFTVTIDGTEYEVEDVLEIASDMPATYRVEVDHFPYLPLDVEIVAA